jgi:uncharacterized protein HemX
VTEQEPSARHMQGKSRLLSHTDLILGMAGTRIQSGNDVTGIAELLDRLAPRLLLEDG